MSRKIDIDPEERGFYFATSGNDEFDGATLERPKQTIQAAIDAASALSPPPSVAASAQVSAAQGGNFDESFVLQEGIQFSGPNVTVVTESDTVITMASFLLCEMAGVTTTKLGGICWLIDSEFSAGAMALFTGVFAEDAVGFDIRGTCESLFVTTDQMRMNGKNSKGFHITATFVDPIDVNLESVILSGDDCIFFDYDPVVSTDACTVEVSTVFTLGFTTFSMGSNETAAFMARAGHLTVTCGILAAFTIIHVESGAELDVRCETAVGNIIVDAGGLLNIDILHHAAGTITNNGTINGIIDGVPFGTYQQKHEEQSVLNAADFTTQAPSTTDTPLQVLFGAAQFGSSDPVELDAAGNITINQTDQYNLRVLLEYGRTNAGQFSLLLFRVLINGTQLGNTQYSQLSTADTAFPIEFSGPVDLVENDILTIEIIRDSGGFDDGSLFPLTPVVGNPAPSAMISMRRNRLVQPV